MKLPWNQKDEIAKLEKEVQELQKKIDTLEDEKESFKKRFNAEKERRSSLSAEKQRAEERINKLEQKIENSEGNEEKEDSVDEKQHIQKIGISNARKIVEKLGSIKSTEEDLATIYSPKSLSNISDIQGLKGSISKENYRFISGAESFAAFLDEDFVKIKLKSRPFFNSEWMLRAEFDTSQLREFIESEKKWAAVSAGETIIFKEENGKVLEKEEVTSRVDSKQKKGGFSQGRFERKRQEQIDEHVRMVEEKVTEDTLLVGEESLCKKLPGRYLGGFDHERNPVDALYNFRLIHK